MSVELNLDTAITTVKTDKEIRTFFAIYLQLLRGNTQIAKSNILWFLGYYGTTVNGMESNSLKDRWMSALSSSTLWNSSERE